MPSLTLTHPAILDLFWRFQIEREDRIDSVPGVVFLGGYYRLDVTEVDDSICDGCGDMGIGGIYVNPLMQQIDIFQCKIGTTTPPKWLGNKDLHEKILGDLDSI